MGSDIITSVLGPIAQLGERTVRIRKVVGSIPIRSTILRKITANSAVIFCCDFRLRHFCDVPGYVAGGGDSWAVG